jgi:hypothetical protein
VLIMLLIYANGCYRFGLIKIENNAFKHTEHGRLVKRNFQLL